MKKIRIRETTNHILVWLIGTFRNRIQKRNPTKISEPKKLTKLTKLTRLTKLWKPINIIKPTLREAAVQPRRLR